MAKNNLIIASFLVLFIVSLFAQGVYQVGEYNNWQSLVSQVFNFTLSNWQSLILQLLSFVVLASFLMRKESPQSKDSGKEVKHKLIKIEGLLSKNI